MERGVKSGVDGDQANNQQPTTNSQEPPTNQFDESKNIHLNTLNEQTLTIMTPNFQPNLVKMRSKSNLIVDG